MSLPSLDRIETPAALVDEDRLEANLQKAAAYMRAHGLRWRPHTKTHKVPGLAARQLQAGASGVTVATPREAEIMSAVAEDVLLAYSPVGASKLARLMALPRRVRLSVALDSGGLRGRGPAECPRAHGGPLPRRRAGGGSARSVHRSSKPRGRRVPGPGQGGGA